MKNVPTIKSTPSFTASHNAIVKAQAQADKGNIDAGVKIAQAFAQFIDACHVAGMTKCQASCDAIGEAIRRSFDDEVLDKKFEKATISNYAQGAQRAFFHALTWSPTAFRAEDKGGLPALPWVKAKPKATVSGKVRTTDIKALLETLQKAMDQCTILNLDSIRGAVLDVCFEVNPKFKEAK
jgi:hypothetical protein